jgi:hypothetical protein
LPGITRRQLVAGLAAFPVAAGRVKAAVRQAPKRSTLSVNMFSSEMRAVKVEQPSTFSLTMPLETDITALRVGLANITPTAYRLDGICCCLADGWQPKASPGWAYLSFGGKSGSNTQRPTSGPQPVVVPGNSANNTGATNVPRLIWSDWIDYPTHTAPDRPQLLFRTLIPPQTLPMAWPNGPGDIGWLHPTAPTRLFAQQAAAGDFVSDPAKPTPGSNPSSFSPIFVIQYRAAVPGVQIVIGGDSHLTAWYFFAQLAAFDLSRPSAPISVWNAAWSGQPSNTFWPCLDDAIDEAQPSLALIEGWTANDGMNPAADRVYLIRVRETVRRMLDIGGVPVIAKGFPRNLFGGPELSSWQQTNAALDHLDPQALVFDPNPYVADPAKPGNWRPDFSTDGIHGNVQAMLALVEPFERLIRPELG